MRRALIGLMLAVCAGIAQAACPVGVTCLSWQGDGHYTDNTAIPANFVVVYTLLYGVKGGPYTALAGYNGGPTQAMNTNIQTPPYPKSCFVVTATADTPDSTGKLSKQTSAASSEVCQKPPPGAPSHGSIAAPSDGSVVH